MRDPWFPIAIILVVLLASWLGIVGPMPHGWTAWLQSWQGLIATIVALTAAIIAFGNTNRSLAHADRLESHRRSRKHAATRAILPLALSQVSEYAEKSAIKLVKLAPTCIEEVLPPMTAPTDILEPLPNETLKALAEFIEFSDLVDTDVLESTVAMIQIHNGRVRGLIEDNHKPGGRQPVVQHTVETCILDAVSIYAGAGAMFNYARRRHHQLPRTVSWENVRNALGNLRLWDHEHPRLYEIIDRLEKNSVGPFSTFGSAALHIQH